MTAVVALPRATQRATLINVGTFGGGGGGGGGGANPMRMLQRVFNFVPYTNTNTYTDTCIIKHAHMYSEVLEGSMIVYDMPYAYREWRVLPPLWI